MEYRENFKAIEKLRLSDNSGSDLKIKAFSRDDLNIHVDVVKEVLRESGKFFKGITQLMTDILTTAKVKTDTVADVKISLRLPKSKETLNASGGQTLRNVFRSDDVTNTSEPQDTPTAYTVDHVEDVDKPNVNEFGSDGKTQISETLDTPTTIKETVNTAVDKPIIKEFTSDNVTQILEEQDKLTQKEEIVNESVDETIINKFASDGVTEKFEQQETQYTVEENLNEAVDKTLINEFGSDDATQLYELQNTPTTVEAIDKPIGNEFGSDGVTKISEQLDTPTSMKETLNTAVDKPIIKEFTSDNVTQIFEEQDKLTQKEETLNTAVDKPIIKEFTSDNVTQILEAQDKLTQKEEIVNKSVDKTIINKYRGVAATWKFEQQETQNTVVEENLKETVDKTLINEFGTDDATQLHEQQDTPTTEEENLNEAVDKRNEFGSEDSTGLYKQDTPPNTEEDVPVTTRLKIDIETCTSFTPEGVIKKCVIAGNKIIIPKDGIGLKIFKIDGTFEKTIDRKREVNHLTAIDGNTVVFSYDDRCLAVLDLNTEDVKKEIAVVTNGLVDEIAYEDGLLYNFIFGETISQKSNDEEQKVIVMNLSGKQIRNFLSRRIVIVIHLLPLILTVFSTFQKIMK